MARATCRTEGCGNAGIAIEVGDVTYTDEETGEERTSGVVCGVCGQPITDLSDAPEVEGQDPGGEAATGP